MGLDRLRSAIPPLRGPRSIGWYAARARAMSFQEVGWRAGSALRRRVATRTGRRPASVRWADADWLTILGALTQSRLQAFAEDAARIAGGELDLWGHPLRVDPRRVEWDLDPLDGTPFSARAWHRFDRDWKPIWELHRQQHLFPLAAGAASADRADWAELGLHQLLDWIARNPPGRAPAWSSGYEAAHRLVGWSWTVPLLVEHASRSTLDAVSNSFVSQAHFVTERPSRYSSANNHRLAELTGLLAACHLGVPVAPWEDLWAELETETARQTFVDGGSREQASGYFLYVLEILWMAGLLARAGGRSLGHLGGRLEAMIEWLHAVAGEDGEPPAVGDDAEDRLIRIEYFEARRAAAVVGRAQALLNGDLQLTPASDFVSARSSVALPESGYAVFRGDLHGAHVRVVMDIGGLGFGSLAAHGHADALSILLDVDGRPVLRDSGTGAYAPADRRDGFRCTRAHNTVVVDGKSQAQPLGSHLWGQRFETTLEAAALSSRVDYVRASHNGYRRRRAGAVHSRSITFVKPDILAVLDRIRGRRPFEVELNWQLAPADARAELTEPIGMTVTGFPTPHEREQRACYSPRYTWEEPAARRSYAATGAEVILASIFALGAPGSVPRVAFSHERDVTTLEIETPRRVSLVEPWTGDAIQVRA